MLKRMLIIMAKNINQAKTLAPWARSIIKVDASWYACYEDDEEANRTRRVLAILRSRLYDSDRGF